MHDAYSRRRRQAADTAPIECRDASSSASLETINDQLDRPVEQKRRQYGRSCRAPFFAERSTAPSGAHPKQSPRAHARRRSAPQRLLAARGTMTRRLSLQMLSGLACARCLALSPRPFPSSLGEGISHHHPEPRSVSGADGSLLPLHDFLNSDHELLARVFALLDKTRRSGSQCFPCD